MASMGMSDVPVATGLASSTPSSSAKKMKVQELRDALKVRGLDTTGLRPALVERLEAALKQEEATGIVPDLEGAARDAAVEPGQSSAPSAFPGSEDLPSGMKKNAGVGGEPGESAPPSTAEVAGGASGVADAGANPSKGTAVEDKASDANGAASGGMTDLEKKQKRAERFGVPLVVLEGDKKKARAEKFGTIDEEQKKKATRPARFDTQEATGTSAKLSEEEEAKRKSRADRFGTTNEAAKEAEAAAPVSARSERRSTGIPKEDLDKAKKRAEKFGIPLKPDVDLEARKKQRAERFGPAVATA